LLVVKQRIPAAAMIVLFSVPDVGCDRKANPARNISGPTPSPLGAQAPLISRHLAPDGTFFLTQRVSVKTASGIIGFAAGSQVTFVARQGESVRVTDGTTEVVVQQSQLTNDLDVAREIAAADLKVQAQVSEFIAQQHRDDERHRAEQQAELVREQQSRTPRPSAPHWANPLDRPAYNRTQDKKYLDPNGKTYWIDVQGRRHYDN
jgi:hypothetical protein